MLEITIFDHTILLMASKIEWLAGVHYNYIKEIVLYIALSEATFLNILSQPYIIYDNMSQCNNLSISSFNIPIRNGSLWAKNRIFFIASSAAYYAKTYSQMHRLSVSYDQIIK